MSSSCIHKGSTYEEFTIKKKRNVLQVADTRYVAGLQATDGERVASINTSVTRCRCAQYLPLGA